MKKEKIKMNFLRGKKKFKASKDQWMYLLQNDLIDVLKVKKALKEKITVENLFKRLLETNPKLSQEQLNDLFKVTEQVISNINISEEGVAVHVKFIDEFTRTTISNRDSHAMKENYFSVHRKKQNIINKNKEILILKKLLEEQREKKETHEKKLEAIRSYVSKFKNRLAKNPTESSNIRKTIERTDLARQQADAQIGVLNTSIYNKETELNILNSAEEAKVIDTISVDVDALTTTKAETQDKLVRVIKEGESLENLNKMNHEKVTNTNAAEDTDFLSDFLGEEQDEVTVESKENKEKEESFEEYMDSLEQ
jgi:hypothetical protein